MAFRRLLPLLCLVLAIALGGCVQAETTIRFQSQTAGELIQHVKLNDRLSALNRPAAKQWFQQLSQRGKQLGGKVRRDRNEWWLTLPFDNGRDLETKFAQLYAPLEGTESAPLLLPEPSLTVRQSNALLAIGNQLDLSVDLSDFAIARRDQQVLFDPGALLDLEVCLETPRGSRSQPEPTVISRQGKLQHQCWKLQSGENQLQASFWLPSFIGIGSLVIGLLVAIGWQIRKQLVATEP
ncbi:DUF3153 domain-containing protein [Synechococcus elongatus IITB7]|uniref:DUF3153 domain-containing protein n=1 Tax=Synechococcus elongatus TaxID=32046 RepID=UPI0030D5F33D